MKNKLFYLMVIFLVAIFCYFLYTQLVRSKTAKVIDNNSSEKLFQNSYSLTEVASHNSELNCWTVIKGRVYDLTTMISTHPSGKSDILKICGIDGTNLFQQAHGNKARVIRQLNTGLIGNLK